MTMTPANTRKTIGAVVLQGLKAFQMLSAVDRHNISRKLVRHDYNDGETVVSRLDNSTEVHFLISGIIRVSTSSDEGKEIQFEDLEPGEMFGELSALDGGKRTGDCISLGNTTVAKMSRADFLDVMNQYPAFNHYVICRLTQMLRAQMGRVFEFSVHTVKDRLRLELLRLAIRHGDPIDGVVAISNPPTHSDLASRIGTHREAITRELNRLQKLGLITWNRRQHTINDLRALKLSIE